MAAVVARVEDVLVSAVDLWPYNGFSEVRLDDAVLGVETGKKEIGGDHRNRRRTAAAKAEKRARIRQPGVVFLSEEVGKKEQGSGI